jgi:hypothetical protein
VSSLALDGDAHGVSCVLVRTTCSIARAGQLLFAITITQILLLLLVLPCAGWSGTWAAGWA